MGKLAFNEKELGEGKLMFNEFECLELDDEKLEFGEVNCLCGEKF